MFELGDYAKELHKKVGKEVAKNNIDVLICSGENSKYIEQEAEKCGMKKDQIYYIQDKEEILKIIKEIAKKDDIILFKASNGMKFYELANTVIEEEFWK